MKEVLITVLFLVLLLSGSYLFGRYFAKGFFKEIDYRLGKKFTEYMNNKNKEENGNKEKK
jgi:hypothetical protein